MKIKILELYKRKGAVYLLILILIFNKERSKNMKKVASIILVSILFFSFALSQDFAVDKGSMIISGMGSYENESGDLYENNDGESRNKLDLTTKYNYFVAQNIAVGGNLNYLMASQGDYSQTTLGIGPTAGYFIGNAESEMYPYLAAGISYLHQGMKSENYDNTISGTDITVSGGIIIPVKNHIGFTAELGYHMKSLKEEDADESISGNIISLNIGISGLLY